MVPRRIPHMSLLNGKRYIGLRRRHLRRPRAVVPKLRLIEAGGIVTVAGPRGGVRYEGKNGYPCISDAAIADMESADFDGVILPGGFMPDKLRRDQKVLELIREFNAGKKPIAAICHGG